MRAVRTRRDANGEKNVQSLFTLTLQTSSNNIKLRSAPADDVAARMASVEELSVTIGGKEG